MRSNLAILLSASAMLVDTALCQVSTSAVLPSETVSRIADAIFRAEGGERTSSPYGIKSIKTTRPRHVCVVTINHAWKDFEGDGARTRRNDLSLNIALGDKVSLPFIQFLGSRYCPSSVDSKGYQNWTNNVWRLYNK